MNRLVTGDSTAFEVQVPLGAGHPTRRRLLLVQVEGLTVDSIAVQGSLDESNWYAIAGTNVSSKADVTSITADGLYTFELHGFSAGQVRLAKTGTGDSVDVWVDVVVQ